MAPPDKRRRSSVPGRAAADGFATNGLPGAALCPKRLKRESGGADACRGEGLMRGLRAAALGTAAYLAALPFGGGPAHANWAYTKWNMTPEEVQAASSDLLELPTDIEQRLRGRGDLQLLLTGEHKMGRYTFDVDFLFVEHKLQRVVMNLRDIAQCDALAADVERDYPQSSIDRSEGAMTSREYQDEAHSNVVGFYAIPRQNICRLSYSFTLSYGKYAD
jgi:hypothetical protein